MYKERMHTCIHLVIHTHALKHTHTHIQGTAVVVDVASSVAGAEGTEGAATGADEEEITVGGEEEGISEAGGEGEGNK